MLSFPGRKGVFVKEPIKYLVCVTKHIPTYTGTPNRGVGGIDQPPLSRGDNSLITPWVLDNIQNIYM